MLLEKGIAKAINPINPINTCITFNAFIFLV